MKIYINDLNCCIKKVYQAYTYSIDYKTNV